MKTRPIVFLIIHGADLICNQKKKTVFSVQEDINVSRYGFLPPGIQIYHRNMSQQEKESIYVMESN